jgi:hypothetical protein
MTTMRYRRPAARSGRPDSPQARPGLWQRWKLLRRQWARVHGTVYCIQARDPDRPESNRLIVAYVGKYAARNWPDRIVEHLYGDKGKYGKPNPAKPWANTVPGYVAEARTQEQQRAVVRQLIADGTVTRLWHGDCFYWYLTRRETRSIRSRRLRPRYNDLENHGNRRRITKAQALAAAEDRRAGRVAWDSRATGIRIDAEGRGQRYGVPLAERVSGPRRWRFLPPAARERAAFYAEWAQEQGDVLVMCPEDVMDRKASA